MNSVDMLKFALFSAIDSPLNLLFALVGGIAGFGVVWFLKWSINKKWAGGSILAVIAAIAACVGTLCYLGMQNADFYLQRQKTEKSIELREDPVWRNDALSRTWNEVVDEENQDKYDRIEDGGTWLPVAESIDLSMYAQQAAQVLEDYLTLDSGTPHTVIFASKEDVMKTVLAGNKAQQVFDRLDTIEGDLSSVVVKQLSQDNPVADSVMVYRVDELYEAISESVDSEKADTMKFILIGSILFVLVPALFACVGGWKDLVSTK